VKVPEAAEPYALTSAHPPTASVVGVLGISPTPRCQKEPIKPVSPGVPAAIKPAVELSTVTAAGETDAATAAARQRISVCFFINLWIKVLFFNRLAKVFVEIETLSKKNLGFFTDS
jgi:hypothetical protein